MSIPGKRVKYYQITNNVTDDVYIGSTAQALYKRLYIHKADTEKGVRSRLCDLIRELGKDKFKIELLEEGVFSSADAVTAREAYWTREKRSSLNEGYTRITIATKEEHNAPSSPSPPNANSEQLSLGEFLLHVHELQQKVQTLETQVKTMQSQAKGDKQVGDTGLPNLGTHTRASSVTTPESFHLSDDDAEAEMPPSDLPNYDLTDKGFNVLRGKIDDEDNEVMKFYFTKLLRIGKHIQGNPNDAENRLDMDMYKELLAKRIAFLRLDAGKIGLDQPCLRLLDTIEKEARIGNNLRKQAAWRAKNFRKECPYEDDIEQDA